ncbi:hypothetical protein COHA_002317 [Chlorella ohadii]|uniref:Amine oxidase n=1 Tax=Chlorella ohadii TaxID=2649997 RepID=A0AAD5DV18_9CHLO|nr:hypothetical protein COHA_002317 [Chlorella ohadii]
MQQAAAVLVEELGLPSRPEGGLARLPEHPLDPLCALEYEQASVARACKEHAASLGLDPDILRFNGVNAQEPVKYEVLAFLRGEGLRPRRTAMAILELFAQNAVVEAVIDLEAHPPCVTAWKQMDGVQAALTPDDVLECEAVLKRNPRFRAIMAQRYGISDVDTELAVDPWYSGFRYGSPEGRVLQCLLYKRSSPDDNHYAHPLDCIIMYDFHTDKIHDIVFHGGEQGRNIPTQDANFHRSLVDRPWRTSLKPLDVVQPEGPSWSVEGNVVTWEGWQFHLGFSWREGLIINDLKFCDQGRMRPVMYRGALAEIIVPYGEPRPPFELKCAYDIVDYGLGLCANPLEVGCDCLGLIKYFDAVVSDSRGRPHTIRRAVCMKEEDAGMAWKHYEYRNGHTEVRRNRRLALKFIATIANYEYQFSWILHLDGTIGFEAGLTGIVSTHALFPEEHAAGGQPQWGTLVSPGVNAHIHQHFFQVRMDMAVDDPDGGACLQVVEVEADPMPLGPGNPHGVGFDITQRVLQRESEAQRMCAPERSRVWKIQNPRVLSPVTGKPVAWKLMPGTPCPPLLAHPTSSHATRGAFATKHLVVTPYHPKEMNPAGDYPLHPDPEQNRGIAQWVQADRNLDGADCVLWYTLGLTHVVRTEDWPVMPVEVLNFHLKPWDFFTQNPTLDLPPIPNKRTIDFDRGGGAKAGGSGGLAASCCAATTLGCCGGGAACTCQPGACACAGGECSSASRAAPASCCAKPATTEPAAAQPSSRL